MKNILAISLLFIFLFSTILPTTIAGDMAKISHLIDHFQIHKKENSNISFWSFLELHYGKDAQKHDTEHDHSKLPLKNTTPSVLAHILMSEIDNTPFQLSPCLWNICESHQTLPSFNKNFTSYNLTDIWQPPRCVKMTICA